jgi:DNA-binding transcriptional LysR family regulator
MRIDYLQTFYWVGTLKSIADAAIKLDIAQATVSHRICMLEDSFKVQLLERKGRGIALTASGTLLLSELPAVLKTVEHLAARLGAPEPETGVLRIGVIESVLHSFLIPWIQALRHERSQLELELTVDTTPNLISAIEHGALDIIVAALAAGDRVRKRVLPAMPMVFVGKTGVHKTSTYSLAEIAQHDLLTFQVSSLPHAALLDQLDTPQTLQTRVHAISSISAMRALVASGFGIATLPRGSLDQATAAAGLCELACAAELDALPLCVSWHEDPARPHIRAIVDSLERSAKAEHLPVANKLRPKNGHSKTTRGNTDEKRMQGPRARSRPRRTAQSRADSPADSRGASPLTHERPRRKSRPR